MNAPSAIADVQRVKLTIDDYLLLDRSGALAGYGRTELVDGVILTLSPQYRPHAFAKAEIAYRLRRALEARGSSLYVGIEASVAIPPVDMPQPDIFLTDEPRGRGAVPIGSIALIVEVSSTTLNFDLGTKADVYAAGEVPEYWVVDVEARRLHQMWAPSADGYGERREVALGERVEAVTIGGLQVDTSDI